MKKLLTVIVMALFVVACTPDTTPPVDPPTPEPEPTPTEMAPEPTDEPEPDPTDTPEPEPTEVPDGPPPTEADLEMYEDADDAREAYQVIDLAETAVPFLEVYDAALAENADWLQDPYEVADMFMETTRRFAEEPVPYEEAFYLPAPPDEAIIIFIQGEFMDDSVWGNKIRMELTLEEGVWEIVWAGEQWRCWRGDADLIDNWHTTLCP